MKARPESVRGGSGAQVYPYDFSGTTTAPVAMMSVAGTTD